MPRPPRQDPESGIHHVVNRGVDRQAIFFSVADRLLFGSLLDEIHRRFGVTTLAYCLMGNHFHLVLRAPPGVLPEAMHLLTSVYSHRINASRGRTGHLFEARYRPVPVESDAQLLCAVRYVHRNPLDLPEVTLLPTYRWSSYPTYLDKRPCPEFVDLAPVRSLVGATPAELVELTEGDNGATSARLSVADVVRAVETARIVHDLRRAKGTTPATIDRTILVLLADRVTDRELGRLLWADLAHPTARAAQTARRRAEESLRTNPVVGILLTWVTSHLGGGRVRPAA